VARLLLGIGALASLVALAACERPVILEGQRFDVRTPLADSVPAGEGVAVPVVAAAGNRSEPVRLPAAVSNAEWTHRAGNPAHQIAPHLALSATPQRVWSARLGEGNGRRQRITAAPVVAGGRVVAMDAANRVTALSTQGAPLWSTDATLPGERPEGASGGGLAAGGGRVFVTTGFGELLALDAASGAILWRQRFDGPVAGAPTVADGTVYVAGRNAGGWAVDAETGRLRWVLTGVPASAGRAAPGAPALAGDTVIFPFSAGELIAATRAQGNATWFAPVTGRRQGRAAAFVGEVTGDPVVAGDVTYAGTAAGRTLALDTRTGTQVWAAPEGALGPVWPAGGSVWLVNDVGELVRLDAATGERIWAVQLPHFTTDRLRRQKGVVAHYGPVLAGGRLFVASSDGMLRRFVPEDGTLLGAVEIPGGAAAAPAVAGGTLYVTGGDGQLHAFR
jgi:outer membrane protein assembly factor BamB